jgi:hypothetical protein
MRRILQIICLLFICTGIHSQVSKVNYSSSSVLSSGTWLKVAVTSDGIYRLDYNTLKEKGLGNLSNPRVFCNNTGQLSYYNDGSAPDDLSEIAVSINTGSDAVFNEGDYLLFYGRGTHRWFYDPVKKEYDFLRHNYSDTAFYFITSSSFPGKKIRQLVSPAGVENYTSNQSDALFIHELENENLIKSGRDWFQRTGTAPIAISPGFTDVVTSEKIRAGIRVAASSERMTEFSFSEQGAVKKVLKMQPVNYANTTGTYAGITDSVFSFLTGSATPSFEIRFDQKGDQSGTGWLDFVKLRARVLSTFNGKFRQISDSRTVETGRITSFFVKSTVNDAVIWDVTDMLNPGIVQFTRNGDNLVFKSSTDSLKSFVVFNVASAVSPIFKSIIPNQDLHRAAAADMIIVTHPLFREYAEKLAGIHLSKDGIVSLVVTPGQIYNEFSGGIQDIAAIRNFIRMKFLKQKGTSRPLKYLLLFGDGSFENKTPPPRNPCFIPTYQSKNSNVYVSSFTSDDFYGLLEDGEGEAEGTEDIGIGRLPVSDTVQAGIVISKIRKYLDPSNMGDWKNIIAITADDEDGNAHMSDAEGLSDEIGNNPEFNIQKIYLDAYRQVTTATGQSYPDVNAAINERINAGCLIFNYIGHGSETGLAHERVVKNEDINKWKNGGKLPLFITATCEFSRFDDTEKSFATGEMSNRQSSGELALLNREGGAIALMSTTRVVFSAPNYFLNRNIYSTVFGTDPEGNPLRLGDIIRIAKIKTGNGSNKRNFSLLGDPALTLAWPWHGRVITDSINRMVATGTIDTLKALSIVTVSGYVGDRQGKILNGFNGSVLPLVFDKEKKVRTLANDGGSAMDFLVRNNILFSGKTYIKNGRFRFTFIVPKDIDYTFGSGKISYYAYDGSEDFTGSFGNITVGGFSGNVPSDSAGPAIRLFMNDTLFRSGGMTDQNPVLLAFLEDKGGINTTGQGIGHDISGYLDNDKDSRFVLNSFYVNDVDNFSKGSISYSLPEMNEGSHSFTLKAWDNFNNSSEETLHFVVSSEGKFILKNLFNFPNPFPDKTKITAETNRPGSTLNVEVRIYNLSGKLIRIILTEVSSGGYTLPPIEWDGNDEGGMRVARGMYPYVVTVSTGKGETSKVSGRMIIL